MSLRAGGGDGEVSGDTWGHLAHRWGSRTGSFGFKGSDETQKLSKKSEQSSPWELYFGVCFYSGGLAAGSSIPSITSSHEKPSLTPFRYPQKTNRLLPTSPQLPAPLSSVFAMSTSLLNF